MKRPPRTLEHRLNLSKACKGRVSNRKGVKLSEETKEKMKNSHLGNKNATGHKLSEESRLKMIQSLKNLYIERKLKGIMPLGWKGGYQNTLHLHRLRYWRKKNNGGTHTLEQWEQMKKEYDFTCPCCGKKEPKIVLTIDHIIPISKGGRNDIENIQPLCRLCNLVKSNRHTNKYPLITS